MGHFATGVTVVTALDEAAGPVGSTANAVASVSLRPPLILVSLRNQSETLAALLRTSRFAVNVLHEGQESLAAGFARRDAGAWRDIPWSRRNGGAPMIEDALATLDCGVHDLADGGDHRIVVGRVAAVEHPDVHVPPLVFYRGSYSRLAPPPAPTQLPSQLGELAALPLDLGVDGVTSVAVMVGRPHGTSGSLIYVHYGCTVGDGLRGTQCARRRALDAALEQMTGEGCGVVVYHRDDRRAAGCCLGGGADEDTLDQPAVRLALEAAVDRLGLCEPRLLVPRDQAQDMTAPAIDERVAR
jgi:flavin reductase (DIM6/NTAB) family NADH-FMN oxidoreductase RutF